MTYPNVDALSGRIVTFPLISKGLGGNTIASGIRVLFFRFCASGVRTQRSFCGLDLPLLKPIVRTGSVWLFFHPRCDPTCDPSGFLEKSEESNINRNNNMGLSHRQQKINEMNGAHLASPIRGELGYAHWPSWEPNLLPYWAPNLGPIRETIG